ncbi:hypothetical protein BGW38_008994, partial [Lunasporangiospora selenospora]
MLRHTVSPAMSDTTDIPDAAVQAGLLPLDAKDLEHLTPEVSTPDIAKIQQFMDSFPHPSRLQTGPEDLSPPTSLRIPSPVPLPSIPLYPDISAPLSPKAVVQSPHSAHATAVDQPSSGVGINIGVLEDGQHISSVPAPPVPVDMKIKEYEDQSPPPSALPQFSPIFEPTPSLEQPLAVLPSSAPHVSVDTSSLLGTPTSAIQSGATTHSLSAPPKRTLPISPLALSSAVAAEDDNPEIGNVKPLETVSVAAPLADK